MRAIPWTLTVVGAALLIGSGASAVGALRPAPKLRAPTVPTVTAPVKLPPPPVKPPPPPVKLPPPPVKLPPPPVKPPPPPVKPPPPPPVKPPDVKLPPPPPVKVSPPAVKPPAVGKLPAAPAVTTPSSPLPAPPTPSAPRPTTPVRLAPVQKPKPTPRPAAQAAPSPARSPAASAPAPARSSSWSSHASTWRASSSTPRAAASVAKRRATSRPPAFLSTRKHARVLVFRFSLRHAQVLRISLFRLAPDCRKVATFRRRGHAGLNVIRLRVVTSGVRLRPGTYRIVARGIDKIVLQRRFVVAKVRPKPASLLAALARDSCTTSSSHAQLISAIVAPPVAVTPPTGAVAGSRVVLRPRRGALGAAIGAISSQLGTPRWLRPILLATVGFALALLLLAALPEAAFGGGSGLLAHHRAGIVAAAFTLLAGVVLAVLLL